MKSKNIFKRIFALLMVLVLCMGLSPVGALAASAGEQMMTFSWNGATYTMYAGQSGSATGMSWSCDTDGNFSMEFTASGTLTILDGDLENAVAKVIGGGGGGSSAYGRVNDAHGGNGGAAGQTVEQSVTVTPGTAYTITVGSGGNGGVPSNTGLASWIDQGVGSNGGSSSAFGLTAQGGAGNGGGAGASGNGAGAAGTNGAGGGGGCLQRFGETATGCYRTGNFSCFICGTNEGYTGGDAHWELGNASAPSVPINGGAGNGNGGSGGSPQNDHCGGPRDGANGGVGGGGGGGGAYASRVFGIWRGEPQSGTGSATGAGYAGRGGNGGPGLVALRARVNPNIQIILTKTSANPEMTNGNSCYSLAGAVYGVYSDAACTQLIETMTTDANGQCSSSSLEKAQYYVKEISPSQGYLLDTRVYTVPAKGGRAILNVTEQPGNDPVGISVTKITDDPASTLPSLEGTQFTIKFYGGQYSSVDELPAPLRTWVIETKEVTRNDRTIYMAAFNDDYKVSGDDFYRNAGGQVVIPIGTLTVQESTPADGYTTIGGFVSDNDGNTLAAADGIVILNVLSSEEISSGGALRYGNEYTKTDKPIYGGVRVQKLDAETGLPTPQGGASFAHTGFVVQSLNENPITVGGEIINYGEGINAAMGNSDENGLWEVPADVLPAGHYAVLELGFPNGYTMEGTTKVEFDIVEDGVIVELNSLPNAIADYPIRADFSLLKQDGEIKEPMAGVKFKITSNTTGESYEFETDERGIFDSSIGDFHFGAGKGGALLYDTYTIEELPCEANKGYTLADPVVFTADGSATAIKIVGVYNYQMRLGTSAAFSDGSKYAFASGTVTVKDDVVYENLPQAADYTLVGKLWDGERFLTDADGNEISVSKSFRTTAPSGVQHMDFAFNADGLDGKSVTVYEYLYKDGEDEPLLSHADSSDANQTVHFPTISTALKDSDTGLQITPQGESVTVTDYVTIINADPAANYTLKGVLMDMETGAAALDADGNEIRAEVNFSNASGTAEVPFTFNGNFEAGKVFVAYEELYLGDKLLARHNDLNDAAQSIGLPKLHTKAAVADTGEQLAAAGQEITITDTLSVDAWKAGLSSPVYGRVVLKSDPDTVLAEAEGELSAEGSGYTACELTMDFVVDTTGLEGETLVVQEYIKDGDYIYAAHDDINDAAQSIYIPEIGTTATDSVTGLPLSKIDEEITINDEVSYENLIPGKEYTVTGKLMDKDTGNPAKDAEGNEIEAETVFTPDESSGTVTVPFTFKGKFERGQVFVAFETLSFNEVELAVHADIEDEGQTVFIPRVKTSAISPLTGEHIGSAGQMTVVDTVTYEQLKPGLEYVAYGTIVDAENPDAILGGAMSVFTAEESSGSVDIQMEVNAKAYAGKTLVVFESILCDGQIVAVHNDAGDADQSVLIPRIGTTAVDSETGEHWAIADEKVTIVDTVDYTSLVPGKEYTINGELVLKPDGKKVVATAEKTFTAEQQNGSVEIEFTFDGSALAGEAVVAFESLKYNDVTLATHADINDEGQTVVFPGISTVASIDGAKSVQERSRVTLIDEVTYTNLIPGKEYTLTGRLVDSASMGTGEVIRTVKDADSKELTAEVRFTPEASSGKIALTIDFNATGLAGRTLVAFDRLYLGDDTEAQPVAAHEDIQSVEQSVSFTTSPTGVKTGDESQIALWLALTVCAGISAAAIVFVMHRRKKEI